MTARLTRRLMLGGVVAFASAGAAMAQVRLMMAYKTPWCGCCDGWVAHMRAAGWTIEVVEREDLAPIRARYGVPDRYAGCHTAVVGAYAIEGHVPAADVERLLRQRPAAVALAAPGMPAGSPGMEAAGRQPYVTLLIDRAGEATVLGRHNGA
jgi:hypothetical protein